MKSTPIPTRGVASARSSPDLQDDQISQFLSGITEADPDSSESDPQPSSLSGKFDSGHGGGSMMGKQVTTFLASNTSIGKKCCGYIGTKRQSFCLRSKSKCSITVHETSKFVPLEDHLYICKTAVEDSAWCDYKAPLHKVKTSNPELISKPSTTKTLTEWKALFKSINSNEEIFADPSSLEQSVSYMVNPVRVVDLMTPGKIVKHDSKSFASTLNLEGVKEEASYDIADLELSSDTMMEWKDQFPGSLPDFVQSLSTHVISMFEDLANTQQNTPALLDVSNDLTNLVSSVTGIKESIGFDTQGIHRDLWSAIDDIDDALNGIDLKTLEETVIRNGFDITGLQDKLEKNAKHWMALGKNWLPKVQSNHVEIGNLKSKLEQFMNKLGVINEPVQDLDLMLDPNAMNAFSHSVNNTSNTTTKIVESLIERIETLERNSASPIPSKHTSNDDESDDFLLRHSTNHHPSDSLGFKGVTYKQFYFADPHAVKLWMKKHMTNPSHGLFVDLVSFSEFFGAEKYTERNTTLNELYMSSKIGHATIADSVVAASFQNVLPGAYGRVSSTSGTGDADVDAQQELPGLTSFAKWDNRDGRTGRRFWIRDETRKTEQQIDGWIRTQLSGPAQLLAKDLLMDSYAMSDCLYTFISTSYEDTMHSNKFDSKQAWSLTSSFVKRIFTELGYVRVLARDGVNMDDPWNTAATFLFATLKAHVIMQDFMRLSIKDHPSISSEMVKFVCYSQPAAGASQLLSRVSAVESLQRSDQGNISRLDTRTKRLESWKSDTDKTISKLKEKVGI